MRLVLAGCLLALAACHHRGAAEPAWPKSAGHVAPETWEDDGGESLEPRGDTMVEDSGHDEPTDDLIEPDLQALIDLAMKPQGDDSTSSDEMIIIDDDPPPPPPPTPTP